MSPNKIARTVVEYTCTLRRKRNVGRPELTEIPKQTDGNEEQENYRHVIPLTNNVQITSYTLYI